MLTLAHPGGTWLTLALADMSDPDPGWPAGAGSSGWLLLGLTGYGPDVGRTLALADLAGSRPIRGLVLAGICS